MLEGSNKGEKAIAVQFLVLMHHKISQKRRVHVQHSFNGRLIPFIQRSGLHRRLLLLRHFPLVRGTDRRHVDLLVQVGEEGRGAGGVFLLTESAVLSTVRHD